MHLSTALFAYAAIFPPEAPAPTLEDVTALWERSLRTEHAAAFVVSVADVPVGVAVAGPDPADPSRGHLSRLYVAPDHWGHGTGRLLHDAALAHLRSSGYSNATLWVLERNERARSWYERMGWVSLGERKPVYVPAGIDDVGYIRAL